MPRKKILNLSLYFLGFFLIAAALWTEKYFGKITVDQALSTVVFDTQGAIEANTSFSRRFVEWCLLWPAILSGVFMLLPSICHYASRFLREYRIGRGIQSLLTVHLNKLIILTGVILVNHQYSLLDYVKQHLHSGKDYFAANYIYPDRVKIAAKKPKSLVLIYVESLETTYENTSVFRNNLLQRLMYLDGNHTEFSHYQQMPGTSWSVAGIVATQCAVPLKLVTVFDGNSIGDSVKHFLPGAKCLGDILAEQGYKNVYLNGAELSFAGVAKFLKEHHYTELYGRDEWLQSGIVKPGQLTGWGLPDDMLLAQAKIKLAALIKDNKPFNLTIFTIDTHGVTGQLSPSCARDGYNTFEGIVECTSNQVAKFVNDIKKQGWLDKVNVVVLGDHLAMKNLATKELEKVEAVPFDMLPSILTSLGFQIEGGRLGLGYTAFGKQSLPRPVNGIAEMVEGLQGRSEIYNRMWVVG